MRPKRPQRAVRPSVTPESVSFLHLHLSLKHQEMDRPGVQQVPDGSGEQEKMEKTGCKIICGAPMTLTVNGIDDDDPLTAGVIGAPYMTSLPESSIFLCSPQLSGTWKLQACPFLDVVFPSLFLCLPCLHPHITVPCKMVLARPDEWETCPYHFSLHLFTMVRRSSCGSICLLDLHKLPCW